MDAFGGARNLHNNIRKVVVYEILVKEPWVVPSVVTPYFRVFVDQYDMPESVMTVLADPSNTALDDYSDDLRDWVEDEYVQAYARFANDHPRWFINRFFAEPPVYGEPKCIPSNVAGDSGWDSEMIRSRFLVQRAQVLMRETWFARPA